MKKLTLARRNSKTGGPAYYTRPGCQFATLNEIYQMIKDNSIVIPFDESQLFLSCLKEKEIVKDLKLLNRIICNGGFVSYIKKLGGNYE